jgi:hypothetical protein
MSSHHPQSLRDRQISTYNFSYKFGIQVELTFLEASIEKILNLNHVPPHSDDHNDHANGFLPESTPIINADGEPIWKVLVFDNLGRDVISSVMRVNDLRTCGVTIHLFVIRRNCANSVLNSVQAYQNRETSHSRCPSHIPCRTYIR